MPATRSRHRHIAIAFVLALSAGALVALLLRTRAAEATVDISGFAFGAVDDHHRGRRHRHLDQLRLGATHRDS